MTLKDVIDRLIDDGAGHLCLSSRQFKKIKFHLRHRNGQATYRGAIITRWEKPRR